MKTSSFLKIGIALFLTLSFSAKSFSKDALEKGFTLKLAYIMPSATFGTFSINDPDNPFDKYGFTSAKPGFGLQLGTMYFINAIDLGDQMKIGVDVTWLALNYQSTSNTYVVRRKDETTGNTNFYQGDFNMYHIYLNMEVGPSFSYSPIEKMALDVSFKLTPTFALTGGNYSVDYNGGNNESVGGTGFGLRFTPAFYFRYSVLLLGIEYNIGDMSMTYLGSGGAFTNSQKSTVPYSTPRIVFGFKF